MTNFSLTPFGVRLATSKQMDHGFVFQARTALTVRSYMFDTRKDNADRLYYQEIFAEGALKKFVTPQTGISFALGAAVDRRLYESERIYVPNSKVTTIKNDFYGRLDQININAVGNHDSIGAGPKLYRKAFGKLNFYFESATYR